MAVFNGVFPILPGKEQAGREFAAACMGERRKGFEAQATRSGLARETWALQETPMGSFMLVWFEAPDIEKAFTEPATSGEEFSIWFRGQVKDVTGVDLALHPKARPLTYWSTGPPEERPPCRDITSSEGFSWAEALRHTSLRLPCDRQRVCSDQGAFRVLSDRQRVHWVT